MASLRSRSIVSLLTVAGLLLTAAETRAQAAPDEVAPPLHLLAAVTEAALDEGLAPARTEDAVQDAAGQAARPPALPVLYASLGVLQGLDLYTTRQALARGAHELNPVMRHDNAGKLLALKTASTMVSVLAAEKLWKKNRTAAVAAMVIANVIVGAVVVNNVKVVRELR